MGLESTTYISGLVATNPIAGDPVSQADDHLRLIKSAVLATFPNITGAVTPTHTELNYVDGVTSAIQTQLDTITTNVTKATLTNGTAVASTSGTSIDFTSIPSWVKRITVNLYAVSTSGTSQLLIQVGDSGGVEAADYLGASGGGLNGGSIAASNFTTGFGIVFADAANVVHGSLVISNLTGNTWTAHGVFTTANSAGFAVTSGSKGLSATLDRVRITTVGGSDTFDNGVINIQYE